jgi:hypothetical protein
VAFALTVRGQSVLARNPYTARHHGSSMDSPWATIVAYDLKAGIIEWRAPLAIVRESDVQR